MGKVTQEMLLFCFAIGVLCTNILILYTTFRGVQQEQTIESSCGSLDHHTLLDKGINEFGEVVKTAIKVETPKQGVTFGCESISVMTGLYLIGSGWTKSVYRAQHNNNKTYAVKTVNTGGRDVNACMSQGLSYRLCVEKAGRKILKEARLLQMLSHPSVLKVFGLCSQDGYNITMVTELGEPLDLIRLLQLSWRERLAIVKDFTDLLFYLAHHRLGSLVINDFRRQQFVMIGGKITLSDADDVGIGDPACKTNNDCELTFQTFNRSQRTSCVNFSCIGFNEKKNICNAGHHLTTFILQHGAPRQLEPLVHMVVDGYTHCSTTTKQLHHLMQKIVNIYSAMGG